MDVHFCHCLSCVFCSGFCSVVAALTPCKHGAWCLSVLQQIAGVNYGSFDFFCLRGKPDFSELGARNSWNGSCFCDFLVFAINATSANSSNHRHSPMICQSMGHREILWAPAHTHREIMSTCCHFTHFDQNWRIRCLSVLQCKTWLDAAGFAFFSVWGQPRFCKSWVIILSFLDFGHQCHICKLIKS